MNDKLKVAVTSLFFLLVIGTGFYNVFEGWSLVDSFYFTSITLTTIGYGDIHPVRDVSKVFTSFFAIIGVGIALYALTMIGADYFSRRESELISRMKQEAGSAESAGSRLINPKKIASVLKTIDRRIKK